MFYIKIQILHLVIIEYALACFYGLGLFVDSPEIGSHTYDVHKLYPESLVEKVLISLRPP